MQKIKIGDDVVVIAGKDKSKRGRVLSVSRSGAVVVENVNVVKKHKKANPNRGVSGGIMEEEAAIDGSNVALFNPAKGGADRVGFKTLGDGRKVRVFKSDNEVVDA